MTSTNLDRAIARITQSGRGRFAGPQPEERITRAERALGIRFPPTYRKFLSQLGAGSFDGEEFYGVIDDDFERAGIPDAIWLTLTRRESGSLPPSFIVVGNTGDGGDYVIDTCEVTEQGESPVLEWWPMAPDTRDMVAADFGDFLWNSVRPPANQ